MFLGSNSNRIPVFKLITKIKLYHMLHYKNKLNIILFINCTGTIQAIGPYYCVKV